MLKIISWNVNGVRACLSKGCLEWINSYSPDIIGLQETKARPEQLEKDFPHAIEPEGYSATWNPADRPGYSGTALFSKMKPAMVELGFGNSRFDSEGRIIIARFEGEKPLTVFNIYFPNGQMDEERLKYKMDFYDSFLEKADGLKAKGENLVIMGDVNTAHREIDLKNPKENEKYSGFLPIERAWIDKFISHGYVDTFRAMHPDAVEYSWWTYRFNSRAKNVGWRIDYVFVNEELFPSVKESFILRDVMGSDHCPVGIFLDSY